MPLPDHWEALITQQGLAHASMHCPHCDRPSTFTPVAQTTFQEGGRWLHHVILRCNNPKCQNAVYAITSKHPNAGAQERANDVLEYYPKGAPPTAHKSLPPAVAEDWVEAQKAINAGCTKAAAVMCRRVVWSDSQQRLQGESVTRRNRAISRDGAATHYCGGVAQGDKRGWP